MHVESFWRPLICAFIFQPTSEPPLCSHPPSASSMYSEVHANGTQKIPWAMRGASLAKSVMCASIKFRLSDFAKLLSLSAFFSQTQPHQLHFALCLWGKLHPKVTPWRQKMSNATKRAGTAEEIWK